MGSGIAQVAAASGYLTIVREIEPGALAKGRASIEKSAAKLVEKGKLSAADRDASWPGRPPRPTFSWRWPIAILAIEAVTEELGVKNRLWTELDRCCPAHATRPRTRPAAHIGAMAAVTGRADRFVGLHFFNPVPLMPLVEVVRALTTSRDTLERSLGFARSLGKEAVVAKDTPGFLVNLLLVPYLLDSVRALERGVGTVTDLDLAMRLGCGHPMGPFTLLDFVGIDTTVRIAEIMFDEYRETRYAAPPLLRRMALAGLHGRKSGKGFYDYSVDPPVPVDLT